MHGQTNTFSKISAPVLRKKMTDAERKLWHFLRGGQLGVKFRRQHPFGQYILDFVCLEKQIVVEVDGAQHAVNEVADAMRTASLSDAGFRVLRFWNNDVLMNTQGVLEEILHVLDPSPPRPSP